MQTKVCVFLLPNRVPLYSALEELCPVELPIRRHTRPVMKDYTNVSLQGSHLPPIHHHPVSFCKVSSVHVACLVQGSQVHAGDLIISRSSGGGGSKTMPPYGDDQEYVSLGYSGHEIQTVVGSNPSPSQSYVLRVFLERVTLTS